MELTAEQAEVVKSALTSVTPVFITGGAGTGKSVILRFVLEELSKTKRVAVAAPTGLAAENVNGVTIHSMFGLPTNRGVAFYDQFSKKPKYVEIANQMDVLLIDEVSMIRSDIMNQIDAALRVHRNDDSPFGGVKVILFGDPYQLPPVLKWEDLKTAWDPWGHKFRAKFRTVFFFSAKVILNCGLIVHELQTSMRAAEDQEFVKVLNRIRVGKADSDDLAWLIDNSNDELDYEGSTHLYGKNDRVQARNLAKLQALPAESEHVYLAKWFPNLDLKAEPIRLTSHPESDSAELELVLRVGARVLFTRNNGHVWRNGTLGTVTSLESGSIMVLVDGAPRAIEIEPVRFDIREMVEDRTGKVYGDVTGWYEQYPLKLGWALTVHKAQGQTLDAVILDFDNQYFAEGQAYVALSRARSISTIRFITPPKLSDLMQPNSDVKGFLLRFGVGQELSNSEAQMQETFKGVVSETEYSLEFVLEKCAEFLERSEKFSTVEAIQGNIIELHAAGGPARVTRFIELVLLEGD